MIFMNSNINNYFFFRKMDTKLDPTADDPCDVDIENKISKNETEPDNSAKTTVIDEKPRGTTPAPELTSFSEALDSIDIDENDMKDIELYDEDAPAIAPTARMDNKINDDLPEYSKIASEESKLGIATPKKLHDSSTVFTDELPKQTVTNSQLGKTIMIHSKDETAEETFDRLKKACIDNSLCYKDIVDSLFNTLVGGPFDLESRYIINGWENINNMLELIDCCPINIQAEIWSIFVAIVKKSFLNLETTSKAGLISRILDRLPETDSMIADLMIQLLTVLTTYSISVKELKLLLRALKATDGSWKRNSIRLLDVMQEMTKRDGPDVFFSFPGEASAGISIPPLSRWPHQNGWTFSTWFRNDPKNSVNFEREKPYLFSFSTLKGVGYFCYFMGNCLVLRCCLRSSGKEIVKCIKHEFLPRKWYQVVLSFVYSRWAKGEIFCYIDGCLVETIEANWLVSTNDHFGRCFLGSGPESDESGAYSGQMGAIYVFSQSITPQQAACFHFLGPSYQSQFKHEAESNLPSEYKKLLFDGKLNESLVFAYCPKDCHGQLVLSHLSSTSKSPNNYFLQVPHAVMKNGVCVITKHSIHNSLHSVGGIQILLPLFSQIDMDQNSSFDVDICSKLVSMVGTLLNTSSNAQQQFIQCQGFSVISSQILRSNKNHFSMNLLETFISISKSLVNFSNGIPLLKQLIESCFFAFHIWVRSDSAVQIRLFDFLVNEFFSNPNIIQIVRRTQTIIILMNTLKKYYSLTPSTNLKSLDNANVEQLDRTTILRIRTYILQLVDYFMFNMLADCDEKEINRNEEFQCILNFISTVQEDDNLYDVLTQLMRQIAEHPAILVPAFDKKRAICVIFSLVSSSNELIRIPALKIFGYYLCRSTQKRKNESINNRNLFYLLTDKLMLNNRTMTLATYNALYEILTEQICQEILFVNHEETLEEGIRFENPQLLKVIAQLLSQSEESPELLKVKRAFLQDMIKLCKDSRENRRLILQMSVWQEWLISLSYIFPQNEEQNHVSELVCQLFSILLFHAIRLEYGGWRVWVDTLAISHSKVSWQIYREENFNRNKKSHNIDDELGENEQSISAALYRTPEFVWSKIQIKFLSDLLSLIRSVIQEWKDSSTMTDQLNNSDNQVFISNTIHILSQLTDSLVMACGGLLPLLAAATAPNSELDIFDTTQQELSIMDAASFLDSFAELADTFIFNSAVNLGELEQEKNMPAGGILRQSLRLVSTVAVRNILTSIFEKGRAFDSSSSKFEAIHNFIKDKEIAPECKDHLLQSLDLQRLKGVIYRDMEETKQAQFLALAIIYFISVLMVSRYRDILEPPTTPSPFFDSKTNGSIRKEIERRKDEIIVSSGQNPAKEENDAQSLGEEGTTDQNGDNGDMEEQNVGISSIKLTNNPNESSKGPPDENIYEPAHLSRFNASDLPQSSTENSVERRQYLTEKLKNSIEPVVPLFREILSDFRPFLQKTLLGTHGQEIMNDPKVMQTLKNGGVIEVVMLLCSQEWQTSLQKHAGLAFIELVNEGRLMAHATRDHILRVSNEADFILNRLRAEDVSKHAQFESETNEQFANRKAEIQLTEQLIISSRRREFISATKLLDKLGNLLTTNPTGAWSSETNKKEIFTKLDIWEDDSRRKRRFVFNPYGQKHSIHSTTKPPQKEEGLEEMLKDLAHKMVSVNTQTKGIVQELIEESEIEKWLKEENSEIFEPREDQSTFSTNAKLIAPGIAVPGTLTLTSTDLYFDADEEHSNFKQNHRSLRHCDILHCRWHFQEIRAIFLRRYLLEYSALELFLASRTAIMFALPNTDVVKAVVSILPPCGIGVKYGLPQSRKSSLMTPWQIYKHSNMPQKWQQREISNFDYLMFLNTIAGRTYNDLNQYPIFPWILSNYTSESLDLNDASNFRDLSKPVGALSETRRKHFQDRFSNWNDGEVPAFHYGTHYSTHAFTLNWLFRIEPFTSYFLELNGRFDHSNRLFHSIADTWEHCLTDTHDVKEVIPELFYLSEMFSNLNGYDLGKREDGSIVGDVVLPPWAKNAEEFVKIHRRALESDLVSCQLNQWIDLIFGYKQRGAEAIRATNVFYYLTYEGAVNLQSIENAALRESIQEQILNFGQTPAQLLTEPHPPRHSIMTSNPLMFKPSPDDLCMLMKFISNSPVVHITANTFQQIENPTIITITQNLVFALNRWNPNYNQQQKQSQGVPFENEKNSQAMENPLSPSELPITVDPLLAVGNPSQKLPKRHLGDPFDQRLSVNSSNFVCTVDSKYIIACGYPDYSFRVIETENAQVRQVIFGHGDIVTCLARSESTLFADCYIASGSADCTVVLWHFSQSLGAIAGEYNAPGESPNPRVILTGHEATISAITISAEHGLVISGAKDGTVLIHTTLGDLLRNILCDDFDGKQLPVNNILANRDCQIAIFCGQQNIVTFTTIGKQLNWPAHKSQEKILCAVLSRDGEFIVMGTECGRISILRLFPLQKVYTFAQTDSPIRSVAISTNQKLIFGGLDSGAIVVFNVDFNRFDASRIRQK